jgi:type II secretory pathway predicted ATPase ExeA
MYESHWQLSERPFSAANDPGFYYPGESHQGAMLKLRYALENRDGGALLVGAAGLGKTLVVNTLLERLPESLQPRMHLVFPRLNHRELLAYVAMSMTGNTSYESTSCDVSIRLIEQFLTANSQAGRHAVLVIDEAHLLIDEGLFDTLQLLLNFQVGGRAGLSLLLVGQPTLLPALERSPGLEQRLTVKCLMRPLLMEETVSYVNHRLQAAGAKQEVFQADALEVIHQLSCGIPRRINRLCDLALLIGFAEQRTTIDRGRIEAVSQELIAIAPE